MTIFKRAGRAEEQTAYVADSEGYLYDKRRQLLVSEARVRWIEVWWRSAVTPTPRHHSNDVNPPV